MPLRPIAEADLEIVRQLRNANRRWFFHDAEIAPEQQQAWFRALGSRPVDFYVIEEAGEVVGTISATRSAGGVEIGNLLLATHARGKGVMRRAVQQLTTRSAHYFADIKADNAASIAVFTACGFTVAAHQPIVRLVKDV